MPALLFAAGMIDLTLGVLFIISWLRVGMESARTA